MRAEPCVQACLTHTEHLVPLRISHRNPSASLMGGKLGRQLLCVHFPAAGSMGSCEFAAAKTAVARGMLARWSASVPPPASPAPGRW